MGYNLISKLVKLITLTLEHRAVTCLQRYLNSVHNPRVMGFQSGSEVIELQQLSPLLKVFWGVTAESAMNCL